MTWQANLKRMLGPRWTTTARCLMRGLPLPRWGNLRRTVPFSTQFGFDRGTPVDRYYLHAFLERHKQAIRGDVLEIQGVMYTRRFGSALGQTHSVDINPVHHPDYLCDLAESESVIPSARYDCFLLPATLQNLRSLDEALRNALRVVRPGGSILASTAGLLPLTPDTPDYWRLSAEGWRVITERVWPGCEVEITAYGNCLTATAAMMGLALEELTTDELEHHDPRYPVLVTLRCVKPS